MPCLKAAKTASSLILACLLLGLGMPVASSASERLVPLTPALTDILLELLPQSRRREIVGTSDFARLPPGLKLPRVASASSVDLEGLARLSPTLILDSPGAVHASKLSAMGPVLKRRGARLEVIPIQSLRDIAQAYRRMGALVGEPSRGEQLAAEFESGLAALSGALSGMGRAFFQIDGEPLMAVGGGSDFLVELLERVGVLNVFSRLAQPYSVVSEESVMAENPEWIVILGLSSEHPKFARMARRWRERHPRMRAVALKRVCVLDADRLTRPSRVMLEGARDLIRLYQGKSCQD